MSFNTYPQNPFPSNSELLQKLDEVAKAIDDMPTFTSDDKAFLSDLPSYPSEDGKKVLTATTTSGDTSLSYEEVENELPANPSEDGTRVLTATTVSGTTVKSWEEPEGGVDYSTTEQNTGRKWYDGKDIYQKVYTLDNALVLSSQDWTDTGFDGSNIGTIINAFGVDSNGTYFNFYATKSSYGGGKIGLYQTRNTTMTINTFVLEYTKATV